MNYHICSQKLIERMEVTGFLCSHLNVIWDVKFVNLNQINSCSTIRGIYPLSHMLAYRLRKMLAQQFVPGCYPVIVEENVFIT